MKFEEDYLYQQAPRVVKYNPYYLAWCRSTGRSLDDEPDNSFEYQAWITGKHREYRKLKGLPVDRYPSGDYAEEFTAWLNEGCRT
jgi:hypothetical protein